MADAYADKRREQLLGLLDPQLPESEQVDSLSEFLEAEVDAAFKRGMRYAQRSPVRGDDDPRARRTSNGGRLAYRSAVQGGVLRRRERQHGAQ